MQVGAAEYPHPPGVAFELVGVDFLVDSALRPWLLEFNAVPSMARQVIAHTGTLGKHFCKNTLSAATIASPLANPERSTNNLGSCC